MLLSLYKNMISEISAVNNLHKDGKIHKTLTFRMIVLGGVSIVFLGMLVSGLVKNGHMFSRGFYFIFIGFIFGFFVFSKIFKIKWDKDSRVIKVRRFDPLGLITLAIYGILRWYLGDVLGYFYHEDVILISSITLSLLFGLTFGRFINMIIKVKKIHEDLDTNNLLK